MSSLNPITGLARDQLLISEIVKKNTRDVAIGPLEYCGSGRIIKIGKSKVYVMCEISSCYDSTQFCNTRLSVCWEDQSLPVGLLVREHKGMNRRTKSLEKKGQAKKAMTVALKRKLDQEIDTLCSSLPMQGSLETPADDHEGRKVKRC